MTTSEQYLSGTKKTQQELVNRYHFFFNCFNKSIHISQIYIKVKKKKRVWLSSQLCKSVYAIAFMFCHATLLLVE